MTRGARTPEELEALLEDAFVTGDPEAVSAMFAPGAVFAIRDRHRAARGPAQIGRLAAELWPHRTYVADPRRVVQARDTALVLADGTINVARRGTDGVWRYAIALLSLHPTPTKEEP